MYKCYRKIWIKANGSIPFDSHGRRYEIHHINGDHSDNRIENLQCVPIQEHFDIHLSQGDYQAASAIAQRMRIAPTEQRRLDQLAGRQAYKERKGFHGLTKSENAANGRKGALAHIGKFWWTNGQDNTRALICPGEGWTEGRTVSGLGPKVGSKIGCFYNNGEVNIRSIVEPGPEWKRGKLLSPEQRFRRSQIGSRPCPENQKIAISAKLKGLAQPKVICPHCGRSGGAGAMSRFHFSNCKMQ